MGNRETRKLKFLLGRARLPMLPPHFTDEVMKEIEAIAEDRVYADARLKVLLERKMLATPPGDFTYEVLSRTRERLAVPVYKPVISKGAWIVIILLAAICSIVGVVTENTGAPSGEQLYLLSVGEYLSNLFVRLLEPLLYLGIVIVSASLLLTLEYLLSKGLRARHIDA